MDLFGQSSAPQVIVRLDRPELPCFMMHGGPVLGRDGRALYVASDLVFRYVPDDPTDPFPGANDERVDGPCSNQLAEQVLAAPDSDEPVALCQDSKYRQLVDGKPVELGSVFMDHVEAVGAAGLLLTTDRLDNGFDALYRADGQVVDTDIAFKSAAVRSHGDGFRVAVWDPDRALHVRYLVDPEGAMTEEGEYAAPPDGFPGDTYGALDAEGSLYLADDIGDTRTLVKLDFDRSEILLDQNDFSPFQRENDKSTFEHWFAFSGP
jgi:hypothetical protein